MMSCACLSPWCSDPTDLSAIPPFVRTVARRSSGRRPLAESLLEAGETQVDGRGFGKRHVHRRGCDLAPEVARDCVAVIDDQRRVLRLAACLRVRTAGAKPAARRRVERTRHVALQDDALPP